MDYRDFCNWLGQEILWNQRGIARKLAIKPVETRKRSQRIRKVDWRKKIVRIIVIAIIVINKRKAAIIRQSSK